MTNDGTADLLHDPRFELLPFMGFDEAVDALPEGARVAVTASPEKGLELTIDRSVELADRGFRVIPHVAARSVRDADHLAGIVDRLDDAGVEDVFVPGGDNEEPAGEYTSSYELLVDFNDIGHPFEAVGITGYPEGHPFIDDDTLVEAMARKEPHATYLVTQLCFDPGTIVDWLAETRRRGVELPAYIGVPGVMKTERMLNIARKVGVGQSVRFVRKTTGIIGMARQLIGGGGRYRPDALVDGLAPFADNERYDLAGLHLYTFNQVDDMERWRRDKLG